jgi:hypothetical protein
VIRSAIRSFGLNGFVSTSRGSLLPRVFGQLLLENAPRFGELLRNFAKEVFERIDDLDDPALFFGGPRGERTF